MTKDQINELIIKFLAGDISMDEMSSLKEKLTDNPTNQQLFRDLKNSWSATSLYPSDLNTNQSWNKTKLRLDELTSGNKIKLRSPGRILKNAALWLLLVSIGSSATWYMMRNKTSSAKSTCEITTPLGSRTHTILPDGSEVWLNAGTTIRYPESFSATQRDIFLTGEAYFKVKTNKKWPFIVHTTDVKIKALGTAFNVKAYPTDKAVVTTLVEGIVKLENEGSKQKTFNITLKPKEKLTFFKTEQHQTNKNKVSGSSASGTSSNIAPQGQDNIEVNENINTVLSTSWKDARWVIDGERLDNLAIALERRYGVKINILSNELINYKFTGTIENETLEQVLKFLKLTTPVKYTVQKGYVDLTINDALKENYTNYLKKTN
jgi:transmembrane sensor